MHCLLASDFMLPYGGVLHKRTWGLRLAYRIVCCCEHFTVGRQEDVTVQSCQSSNSRSRRDDDLHLASDHDWKWALLLFILFDNNSALACLWIMCIRGPEYRIRYSVHSRKVISHVWYGILRESPRKMRPMSLFKTRQTPCKLLLQPLLYYCQVAGCAVQI